MYNKAVLRHKGPLLLACNHPNSFLDAVVVGSLFKEPVYYLARGDAFKNPVVSKVLAALKLMPIYRLSEGREYLSLNDATFDRCNNILKQGGIVLIFSEGLCKQQWALQPLKKGTARIAFNAWNEPAIAGSFRIQPVSLSYNTFTHFNKQIIIQFGEIITRENVLFNVSEGERIAHFNQLLTANIKAGMLLSKGNDSNVQLLLSNHNSIIYNSSTGVAILQQKQTMLRETLAMQQCLKPYLFPRNKQHLLLHLLTTIILLLPALIGFIFQAPLYILLKSFVQRKTDGTVFYNSVFFGLLLILYPLYYCIVNIICINFIENMYIVVTSLLMPFFALLFLFWYDNLQALYNFFSLQEDDRKKLYTIF